SVVIATTTGVHYADSSALVGSTPYTYKIIAFDVAQNLSLPSNVVTVTTPDTLPPSKPVVTSITAPTSNQVVIMWSASTDTGGSGVKNYKVFREGVEQVTTTTTTYTDNNGISGTTTYHYTVQAFDIAGNPSLLSDVAIITTPDTLIPTAPTITSAIGVSGTQIDVTWSTSTDTGGSLLSGYRVYRGGSQVGTSATTTYHDSGLVSSTTYIYNVEAYDGAGNRSAQSAPFNGKTLDVTAPGVPTGLSGAASSNGSSVGLTWTAPLDNPGGTGVSGYLIFRGGTQIGTSPTASYTDSTIANGVTYSYTVAAYDGASNTSAQSSPVSVTTPSWIQITDVNGLVISAASALYSSGQTCSTFAPCVWSLKQKYGSMTEVGVSVAFGATPTCPAGIGGPALAGYRRPSPSSCRFEALSTVYGQ
ncbi:MAG: hypothetical protein ABI885_27170, partial [Gammaproteobacteria bacterium]